MYSKFQVTLVRWNEPYQKLASCDTSGIIFVWIKYEGRWSIELINDRNTPVICFSWSHDGRMALICYQDGFVLVGSVAGQRYWSTLLPPDINNITSGIWTPDDQHVYLGTSQVMYSWCLSVSECCWYFSHNSTANVFSYRVIYWSWIFMATQWAKPTYDQALPSRKWLGIVNVSTWKSSLKLRTISASFRLQRTISQNSLSLI